MTDDESRKVHGDGGSVVPESVETLKDAISDGNAVRIKYISGKDEKTDRIIEPLGLTFESFRWHLFAYCRLRDDTRFFRLDRMEEVEVLDDTIENRELPPMQQRMVDLIRSRPMEEVILRFDHSSDHQRFRRKCSYGLTCERTTENGVEFCLKMSSFETLSRWLLPYGRHVTIIHPPAMKRLMHDLTEELYKHHRIEED
jgi:predicted DNA-binding transcriptional regulator YafY